LNQNWPEAVGLRRQVNGTWAPVIWREFTGQVRSIAAGLITAGIQPGDRVALMSRTKF
jgi:long-chain acyl-CoA synthetase